MSNEWQGRLETLCCFNNRNESDAATLLIRKLRKRYVIGLDLTAKKKWIERGVS